MIFNSFRAIICFEGAKGTLEIFAPDEQPCELHQANLTLVDIRQR